jgi:hypothetical protein
MRWIGMLAALTLLLAGCSSSTPTEPTDASATQPNPGAVGRADFGKDWPLTVESGVLSCEGAGAVYFTTGGLRYAVNGLARGIHDAPDIDPIWAKDPSGTVPKKNIGPLITRGLQLCG